MTERTEKELYELFENHNSNSKNKLEPEEIINLVDSIKEKIFKDSANYKVKEFMTIFKQETNDVPKIPSLELVKLRLNLLLEELCELAVACGGTSVSNFIILMEEHKKKLMEINTNETFGNITECLDAFTDLQYILSGGVHLFGFTDIIDESFDIVHNSNMSKLCKDGDELEATKKYYEKQGINVIGEHVFYENQNMYLVKREDNKILKNYKYIKADFSKLLDPLIYDSL